MTFRSEREDADVSPQHEREELEAQHEEETARWTDTRQRPIPNLVELNHHAVAASVNAWRESEAERWRRMMAEDVERERAQ